jgi:hypothetical protein
MTLPKFYQEGYLRIIRNMMAAIINCQSATPRHVPISRKAPTNGHTMSRKPTVSDYRSEIVSHGEVQGIDGYKEENSSR